MIDDLAKLLRAKRTYTTSAGVMEEWINPDGPMAADRIVAQAAEIERLRGALELADAALRGANMNMNVVERKIREALAGKVEQ
jgi:hypothetical protein